MASFNFFGLFGKPKPLPEAPAEPGHACQICGSAAHYLDTVDFHKFGINANLQSAGRSETPIDYYLCPGCGFCFAPEIHAWPFEKFEERIYNDEYHLVDPDYLSVRPHHNLKLLDQMFGRSKDQIRHMDYGGGSGLLSRLLCENGWSSQTYDPFVTPELAVADLGRFDLVTAFEVFEHVPDVPALIKDLNALCKPDGIVLFTTYLSDGNIAAGAPLTWWYASPRNGHISLFSAASLTAAMTRSGFDLASFSDNLHLACRGIPPWAGHLIKKRD